VDELLMFEQEGHLSTPSDSKNSSSGGYGAAKKGLKTSTVISKA
jgi:hypothetical protein